MGNISLVLHLPGHDLFFYDYTTLDIGRRGNEININITNSTPDLAFNATFDKILELLGNEESFSITVVTEKGEVTFHSMAADYHLNNATEVLHFGKVIRVQNEQETE